MGEAKVRVVPSGPDLTLAVGERLMAGAERLGYRWPTVCGGQGDCLVCRVRVIEGAEFLGPESRFESERLRGLRLGAGSADEWRLACQAEVLGDVVVEKRGVRRRDSGG